MLVASRIRCKKLRRLFKNGDESGIRPEWRPKVRRILNALDVATHPLELDTPGNYLHELRGNRKGTFSVLVSGNWRITFLWDEDGPYRVNLEDYHGK
jgi:toxin HigB-1